jgi:hypothetical protein
VFAYIRDSQQHKEFKMHRDEISSALRSFESFCLEKEGSLASACGVFRGLLSDILELQDEDTQESVIRVLETIRLFKESR